MAFQRTRSGSKDSDLSLTPHEWDERARGLLLARLTRGPRTKTQLARMLAEKGVPEEIALPLLDRFQEVGLIDDSAYARAFSRDRRETRGLAKSALRRELGQAGVDIETIDEALGDYSTEDDQELAIKLVDKRWDSLAKLEHDARYRRLLGYLGRRGFSSGTITAAIRAVELDRASRDL
jgi:regulatory protein